MTGTAIDVSNVTKRFRIYHEKRNSVYEALVGRFSDGKYYEDLIVLKNVSFSINKGEMFGIVGKNGTGKTTLLRIISGIYKPDEGNIMVNGSLIPLLALGAGFQMELTAKTNVIQYGILLGFKRKEIEARVDKVMAFAELEKFADTKLKNFSSGMYTRLAFSTAIQIDPEILIIDEVLQVGDLTFRQKSYEAMLSFKKRGKTMILVTHDIASIQDNCDRAMFLNQGTIASIGDPAKVVEDYKRSSFT